MSWASRVAIIAAALVLAAMAPQASAQGAASPTMVVVVRGSSDKVWLYVAGAPQGPANLVSQGQTFQATFAHAVSTTTDAARVERHVLVTHHFNKALPPFWFLCDARCTGDRRATVPLPYYAFARPTGMLKLDLGDLTPVACGTGSIVPSVSEQDHPESYDMQLMLGWWSAYQDCDMAGQRSSLAAIGALENALKAANALVLRAPDRYAIDTPLVDAASTVLSSSALCTSAPINPRCYDLRRQWLRAKVVDASILNHLPQPSANVAYEVLQTISAAKSELATCLGADQVQLNVCADVQSLMNLPDPLGSAWCAVAGHDPQTQALCLAFAPRNPLPVHG